MADSSTAPTTLDRINLRLSPETFEQIDIARAARPGHVSRNTWLTEAVEEKLARDLANLPKLEGRRHG
jgi:predicted HicB family RNase H-like nuclease